MATSRLSDDQLAAFDNDEAITETRWRRIQYLLDRDFPDGAFSFIEVGGGNGLFADRLLSTYPKATGAIVDNSAMLLAKNTECPRKSVILGDAVNLPDSIGPIDVAFCNWVFHHLVESQSYDRSRENVNRALAGIRARLSARGRLSVMECDYTGYIDSAPGRIVFALTASKWFAPFAKRLGANTAGVGVCYLSHNQWRRVLTNAGYRLIDHEPEFEWRWPSYRKAALLLKHIRHTHYWLAISP